MSDAFAPIVRARPNPIFGRPVHQGSPPFDYSPILLLKPFGFRITPDTLSSSEQTRWPTRHYPRLWIQRPSSERRRDLNPPDSCAAQRTLLADLPAGDERDHLELDVQVALGAAIAATRGFAALEVGRAYERAVELCRQRADHPELPA